VGELLGSDVPGGGNPQPLYLPAATPSLFRRRDSNTRTIRVRLLLPKSQVRVLERVADNCAKLWNEVNYERRKLFYEDRLTERAMKETYEKYYEMYRGLLGSAIAQQVLNLNDEAWRSFYELLEAKREGRLPPFIRKVRPPGYWKDRELGKRIKRVIVRSDRYVVEPISEREGFITLKDLKLKVKYAGQIKWAGRQGRMAIVERAGRWYAYIPVEVGARPPKSNPRGYIRGEHDRIKQREPKGSEAAFIDMGLNNLFAVVTTGGDALLVKGDAIKAEYFRGKSEARTLQAVRDILRKHDVATWREYHYRYLRAVFKTNERLRHLYRTAVSFLAEWLYERGVQRVYLGYPYMITQDNGNEYNTNIWWYRKLALWLYDALQEYGIELLLTPELRTSVECSICHIEHNGARVYRGLYICERTGKKLNADLNAANNIAHRAGYEVAIKKIESYKVTHSGVKPVTPLRRGAARDPSIGNPALQGREGVIGRGCYTTWL